MSWGKPSTLSQSCIACSRDENALTDFNTDWKGCLQSNKVHGFYRQSKYNRYLHNNTPVAIILCKDGGKGKRPFKDMQIWRSRTVVLVLSWLHKSHIMWMVEYVHKPHEKLRMGQTVYSVHKVWLYPRCMSPCSRHDTFRLGFTNCMDKENSSSGISEIPFSYWDVSLKSIKCIPLRGDNFPQVYFPVVSMIWQAFNFLKTVLWLLHDWKNLPFWEFTCIIHAITI